MDGCEKGRERGDPKILCGIEEKKRANALLKRIWSNRKRKEIIDILSYPNPPHSHRCYFGGFLRYGVGLTINEILEICDTYAKWDDYNRGITDYHLRHIGKENRTQEAIRTFHREDERSESSFSSPKELSEDAKRWIGVEDPCGFVLSWIRIEGGLG